MASVRRAAIRDQALVLRRFPYGESSLVVHVLTRTRGRVAVLAKGAYRMRSRYFGVLDLFDTLGLEWRASGGELVNLVAADVLRRRRALSADLDRYRTSLHVLELVGLAAREGEPATALFALTEEILDALTRSEIRPDLARIAFELAFLEELGLKPALDACASCGSDLDKERTARVPVSVAAGGRLCAACARGLVQSGREASSEALGHLRVARSLLGTPRPALGRVRVDERTLEGVDRFVRRFLEYHLETRPRARTVRPARRGRGRRTPPPSRSVS